MLKKFVAAGAVVALAYTGSTWYVGGTVKKELHSTIDALNNQLTTHLSDALYVSIEDYQRGVFGSNFTLRFNLQLPNHHRHLDIAYQLGHGPFPIHNPLKAEFEDRLGQLGFARYTYESRLVKNELTQFLFDDLSDDQNPLHTVATVGFNGLEIAQQVMAPQHLEFQHDGLTFTLSIDETTSQYRLSHRPFTLTSNTTLPSYTLDMQIDSISNIRLGSADIKQQMVLEWQEDKKRLYLLNEAGTYSTQEHIHFDEPGLDDTELDPETATALSTNQTTTFRQYEDITDWQDDGHQMSLTITQGAQDVEINHINLGGMKFELSVEEVNSPPVKNLVNAVIDTIKDLLAEPELLTSNSGILLLSTNLSESADPWPAFFSDRTVLSIGPVTMFNELGQAQAQIDVAFSPLSENDMHLGDEVEGTDLEILLPKLIRQISADVSVDTDWLASFLPSAVQLMGYYNFQHVDFEGIAQRLSEGLVQADIMKQDGQRLLLNIEATAPEGHTFEELDSIRYNDERYTLDEFSEEFEQRGNRLSTILEDNGFNDLVETIEAVD